MSQFELHKKLIDDCEHLGKLSLSEVLLMKDERFPWLILVPTVPELRDLYEVPSELRLQLFEEIELASKVIGEYSNATKINVAALGNMVPQLHVHVIARRTDDAAWPGPVWNAGPAPPVNEELLTKCASELRKRLFNKPV
tara:strand:+ start:113 stop:532 length:420 start_codon:yes stop_codon:yes gene_type:complete